MTRLLALMLACVALGLVAAGCGDDDDDGGDSGSAQTTEQTTEATTTEEDTGGSEPSGETVEVGMRDIKFDPVDVTVPVGGTVKWTNNEAVPHDVTKEGGPGEDFSSGQGNMQEGDTYEQTFPEAGKVEYVCTVHPGMTGTVTVE